MEGEPRQPGGPGARPWIRIVALVFLVLGGVAGIRMLGLGEWLHPASVGRLREWLAGSGRWGPLVFVAGYAVAELFFVPGLPLTVLGGLAFGPFWGIAWVSAGSTLGAALAFLAARYAMRGQVERWIARSPRLARLDAAVDEHGWRILVVTRLVPLFPFNLQNFAYGLTRMPFWRYVVLSWICMLPGTAAYTLAAGALAEGTGDPTRTIGLLAVAGVLIVLLSLLPRWLGRAGLPERGT